MNSERGKKRDLRPKPDIEAIEETTSGEVDDTKPPDLEDEEEKEEKE